MSGRDREIKAMEQVVDAMLTAWCMGLSQEAKDALAPKDLDELRDGFIEICKLGLED